MHLCYCMGLHCIFHMFSKYLYVLLLYFTYLKNIIDIIYSQEVKIYYQNKLCVDADYTISIIISYAFSYKNELAIDS